MSIVLILAITATAYLALLNDNKNSGVTATSEINNDKPYELLILTLVPFTGNSPRDGKICSAAMQLAVDVVNSRRDILPRYRLRLDIRDEATASNLAPARVIEFLNENAATKINNNRTSLAPVAVGNYLNCQNTARIFRQFNMVQFSTGCNGPLFTADRVNYPNLYRNRIPLPTIAVPEIIFTQRYGKWQQIGIVFCSANVNNEFVVAKQLYRSAIDAGLQVVFFMSFSKVGEQALPMMLASDARIWMIEFDEVARCITFLCNAHVAGLRGSSYVFFMQAVNYVDPMSDDLQLPPGCTRQMILDQMRITFWVGPFDFGIENFGRTTLGYDLNEFDRLLDARTNRSRSADYVRRHRCHDSMEMAILALQNGEEHLLKQNKSLIDYRNEPEKVMLAVNESAAKSNFIGLRIGRIHFSDRVELDFEYQWVAQYDVDAEKMRYLIKVGHIGHDSRSVFNLSLYNVIELAQPIWATETGRPPKDLSNIYLKIVTVPTELLITIAALVTLISVVMILLRFDVQEKSASKIIDRFELRSGDGFMAFGLLILNCSAITYVIGPNQQNSTLICPIRPILAATGCSFINGVLFFKIVRFVRIFNKIENQRPRKKLSNNLLPGRIKLGTSLFLFVNLILLLTGTNQFQHVEVKSLVYYDHLVDSYCINIARFCSTRQQYFGAALWGCHGVLLSIACLLIYEYRRATVPLRMRATFRLTRIAVVNATTIFLAVMFLVYLIPNEYFVTESTVMSAGMLLYSVTTSAITKSQLIGNVAKRLKRRFCRRISASK